MRKIGNLITIPVYVFWLSIIGEMQSSIGKEVEDNNA